MEELITNKEKIKELILELCKTRDSLQDLAKQKAQYIAEYELQLSKAMIRLKNGERLNIDGTLTPENIPATLIEKIAKGYCYQSKANADYMEEKYKLTIIKIRTIETMISAFQSINRYLDQS